MYELRVRTKIAPEDMAAKVGKILTPRDYNVKVTGATRVLKPNGETLLVYLPEAIPPHIAEAAYPILHTIKGTTTNRGLASGSKRVKKSPQQSYALPVKSSVVGSFERQGGRFQYCRLTAWTGQHTAEFRALYPYFGCVNALFEQHVPERYIAQRMYAERGHPDWRIPGTAFSTVTVNNTYPTGVHKDEGDYHPGFGCMTTLRRGYYQGGELTLPEYRVAIDMQDRDVLLFDVHEWHGNTSLTLEKDGDAERISVVLYYREGLKECGSSEEEVERGKAKHDVVPQ